MRDDDNLTELRAALRADAAGVAEALLGVPNKATSTRATHRWGSKGSFAVEVRGPKRGLWFTHEAGEGNDLLGLIQHVHRCNFPDALAWARKWTGVDPDDSKPFTPPTPSEPDPDEAAEADAARAGKIATAQRIAAVALPIAGTTGEYYLKQNRGIPVPAGGWPDAIRWHPAYRAVVAVATAADGTVQAVQRIHLDANGRKIGPEEQKSRRLPAVKVTNGPQDGAAVRLPGDPNGPLLLAEGPETGLAAYTATSFETWIALGSLGKLEPPAGRVVVAIADDNPPAHDARYGQAAKALRKTLTIRRRAGVNVVVATPWEVRRRDRSDLADVILHHGRDAVLARVMAALEPAGTGVKRVTVEQARDQVATAVGTFFDRVDGLSAKRATWDAQAKAAMANVAMSTGSLDDMPPAAPPASAAPAPMSDDVWREVFERPAPPSELTTFTHGVRVTVGVGKSHEARIRIARTLTTMRERGDKRTIVLAVPMHALGNEQAANFTALPEVRKAGLRVAIWRGRAALDPDHADYGHADHARAATATMCQDLERVHDAQAVGLSAQTSVCKRRITRPDGTKATVKCPLFDGCSYQAQMHRKADLWIAAHTALFHEKPEALGEVAALVVDEAAWKKGLIGAEGQHITLSIDALNAAVAKVPGITGSLTEARLQDLRRRLFDLVRDMPEGPVQAKALSRTLLTADSAAEAHKLEWSRKVDPLHPGQTRDERRAAMEAAEGNRLIPRMSMAWLAMGKMLSADAPDASGWLEVATDATKDGPVRVLRIKGRHDIRDGWKVPTLLIDALLPVDLVRPFWPDVEMVADVHAAAPHQRVRQVIDRAYSKSMLEQLGADDAAKNPEEARRRSNRLHDLRAILIREARHHAPGRVLVVLQQSVEKSLMALGSLPPNLSLAHHNNIAGRDEWRDVAAIVVVGRTMPPPSGVERIAEALTGQVSLRLPTWYERADAVREMANGQTISAEADRHPDALAEAIRWQAAEGELVQIIGRGRGVNRTAANPLDVLVLTDAVLPIPLAGTLEAADLEPGVADHMIAAGGVVFENPADASAAYPFLWANREAAKKALQREKSGTFPYRDSSIGECPLLRRIDYKPAGQGKQAAIAGFDPVLCPDPVAFLTERVGSMVWCRIEAEPPPPEPDPPQPDPGDQPASEILAASEVPVMACAVADAVPVEVHEKPVGAPDGFSPDHIGRAPTFLVCDVPWLHPEVAAIVALNGQMLVRCPYCGKEHRHGGFGHRLAHCDKPAGRGYVLIPTVEGVAVSSGAWS